jgi:phosphomannomutase
VRPSGTEDVVQVYAEAATQDAADKLARVACHVHSAVHQPCASTCAGVGSLP